MKANKILVTVSIFLMFFGSICLVMAGKIEQELEQGQSLMKSGDFKKSADLFKQILTEQKNEIIHHPRHAETWYLFSVSLRKLGRANLADKALERAKILKESQKDKPAQTETSEISTLDFSEKSISETSVNKMETGASVSETLSGNIEQGAYDLPSLQSEQARDHHRKGAVCLENGQLQSAADEFLAAIDSEPANIELLEKTATILDQIGGSYYQKGQKVFSELEKNNPGKLSLGQKIGSARANIFSGKPDFLKAESILKELIQQNPDNLEVIILSAQLDSENKRFKMAIEKLEKAIKLDKNNMTAYLALGDTYQKMAQFPKAIEVLQQARELWPESFMPLVSLGNAYLRNGENGRGLVMFNLAYGMNPDSFDVNLGMLEILARKGDYRSSVHLNKCEKIAKGDPRVEYWKAIFCELDERTEDACKIYSVLAMYQDEIAYRARLRLGQLYAGIGHETFPGQLLVVDRPRFIRVYQCLFDQEMAFAYLQEFIEKRPDAPEAKSVKSWLDENEEDIRYGREFDALIQSQISKN